MRGLNFDLGFSVCRPAEVEESEYEEFYKAITKDSQGPLSHIHFIAEGEVTFKSVLYIPKVQQSENFNRYGTRTENIKVSFFSIAFIVQISICRNV